MLPYDSVETPSPGFCSYNLYVARPKPSAGTCRRRVVFFIFAFFRWPTICTNVSTSCRCRTVSPSRSRGMEQKPIAATLRQMFYYNYCYCRYYLYIIQWKVYLYDFHRRLSLLPSLRTCSCDYIPCHWWSRSNIQHQKLKQLNAIIEYHVGTYLSSA